MDIWRNTKQNGVAVGKPLCKYEIIKCLNFTRNPWTNVYLNNKR